MKNTKNDDSGFYLEPEHQTLGFKNRVFSPIDIHETKLPHDNPWGMVRLYCTQFPNHFNLQIRACQPLDDMKKNKPRNIIATVSISKEEILMLAEYVKRYPNIKS